MSFIFLTPFEITGHIAKQAREKRLALNITQKNLSERSGVSFGVVKKFERTGKISLESLLRIALILDSLEEFTLLFKAKKLEQFLSLDDIIKSKKRQRGRK